MRTVFDPARNESGLVDRYIGTAFDIVLNVHDNLAQIKQMSFYLEDVVSINNHITELTALAKELDKLLVIYNKLDWLSTLNDSIKEYLAALTEYKALLASTEGAKNIGTSKVGVTIQDALTALETDIKTASDALSVLKTQAVRSFPTRTVANAMLADIPEGDIITIVSDETYDNSPTHNVVTLSGTNKALITFYDLNSLKKALALTTGAALVNTLQNKTAQDFFSDLYNQGVYFAATKALAVSFVSHVKEGTLIIVLSDESIDNGVTMYKATTDNLTFLWDMSELGNALSNPKSGSALVSHANADGTTTTVKTLLNSQAATLVDLDTRLTKLENK